MTLFAVLALAAAGCASFPGAAPEFSPAPTLTPNVATVIPPDGARAGATLLPEGPGESKGDAASPQPPTTEADPCAPPALPVVAVCLDDPWGLAPLPAGDAALVGERTSGRILSVKAGQQPVLVATITGLDFSHGGGLLGLALSPYYAEDGLFYAYVTTSQDARVVRLAAGQEPKPVVTGLPSGTDAIGGSLLFDADGLLYIAVGGDGAALSSDELDPSIAPSTPPTTTAPGAATDPPMTPPPGPATTAPDGTSPGSSASPRPQIGAAIYRVDTFGRPASQNTSGSGLFADGLHDPTGMCLMPDGRVAAMDHRATGDVLIALVDGREYRSLAPGDAVWTYSAGDGGAVDCAVTAGELTATARSKPKATSIEFGARGSFIGSPTAALDGTYGLLRTAVTGPGGLTWLTTANTAAQTPAAKGASSSDDRVVVLPPSSAAGGGGGLD
jgi:glucose/arabinose dehydrogenase